MIRIFKLTTEQKRAFKKWNERQTDKAYFDWYENQKENSKKYKAILREAKFREGKDLALEELYQISKLLTEYLGNTALNIRGPESKAC